MVGVLVMPPIMRAVGVAVDDRVADHMHADAARSLSSASRRSSNVDAFGLQQRDQLLDRDGGRRRSR